MSLVISPAVKAFFSSRITQYALLILFGLGVLRAWGNAQWAKGVGEGQKSGVAQMEKLYKESWQAALKRLDDQEKAAALERVQLSQQLTLSIARTNVALVRLERLTSVALSIEEMEKNHAEASAVPAAAIDDTLRAISRQLDELTKQQPAPNP